MSQTISVAGSWRRPRLWMLNSSPYKENTKHKTTWKLILFNDLSKIVFQAMSLFYNCGDSMHGLAEKACMLVSWLIWWKHQMWKVMHLLWLEKETHTHIYIILSYLDIYISSYDSHELNKHVLTGYDKSRKVKNRIWICIVLWQDIRLSHSILTSNKPINNIS